MSSLKKVAANSFFYTASSILLRASSIIFFPIFSLYLTKADYGILSITQSIGGLFTIICGLELNKAITRQIFNDNDVESYKNDSSLIFTTLLTSFFFGCLIVLILSFTGSLLLKPLLNEIPFYPYVFVFLLSIPLSNIIDIARTYYKAKHEGFKAFVLDMSFFSSNIILNLLFVAVLKMGVLGIFIGSLTNTLFFSIILYYIFYRKFTFNLDKNILKNALSYAIPLVPYSLLNILFESIDRFFLNADSGSQISGIYYISLTFAAIFSAAKESIINAFTPWVFANINEKSENYISNIINTIFISTGLIAISIAWFSKEILMILSSNPDFVDAYKYIPFTVIGLYIIFLGQLYNIRTFYYGKYNRYLFLATVAGIIADIIACYYLVDFYGIYGAIMARLIAFTIHVAVLIYLSSLEIEKKNLYKTNELIIIAIFTLILTSLAVMFPFSILVTLVKITIMIIIIAIMIYYFNKQYHFIKQIRNHFQI